MTSDRTYTPAQMADAVQRMIDDGTYMPWDLLPKLVAYLRKPAPGAEAMREAIALLRDASYQNHTGHFDKTGGSGSGCPECIRARDLRDKADAILAALPAPEVPE